MCKKDNAFATLLNDNPRKYKYNPYPIYSEGVLFLDHKRNRTSLSYMFFLKLTRPKHELKRLSKKENRKRKIGAGRQFKLDIKNRFVMLLVYYRLYITYTLTGFLFDLDQSNICRDIQKIEY
jgi:hypothetical protein